jgi:hypothetical protein
MTNEQKTLKVFETLYEKQYKSKYKTNKNDKISDFLQLARSKGIAVGESFIVTYILYQYSYYYKLEEMSSKVRLSWLLSEKSINRFFERDYSYDFSIGYRLLKDFGINKAEIIKSITKKVALKRDDFLKLDPVEENTKKNNPFKDKSIRKLWYCKTRTTMYHPKSDICCSCDMKDLCKGEQNKLTRIYRQEDGNAL